MNLADCPLASSGAPLGCDWCGRLLTGSQTRWCSRACMQRFRVNHVWRFARPAARARDGACLNCGSVESLEVNHIVPLAGRPRRESCAHHQSNLQTLCHDCHVEVTRAQRAVGWFQRSRPHDV